MQVFVIGKSKCEPGRGRCAQGGDRSCAFGLSRSISDDGEAEWRASHAHQHVTNGAHADNKVQ